MKHVQVELPPISDCWREGSVLFRGIYVNLYSPERQRNLADLLRSLRTLLSIEEVFGAGLLDRMESVAERTPMIDQAINTVDCELCGDPTRMTGTKRCDRCYELETRVQDNPELAALILQQIEINKQDTRQKIKERAHEIDPECWISYSGKPRSYKRYMDHRRTEAMRKAAKELEV